MVMPRRLFLRKGYEHPLGELKKESEIFKPLRGAGRILHYEKGVDIAGKKATIAVEVGGMRGGKTGNLVMNEGPKEEELKKNVEFEKFSRTMASIGNLKLVVVRRHPKEGEKAWGRVFYWDGRHKGDVWYRDFEHLKELTTGEKEKSEDLKRVLTELYGFTNETIKKSEKG